MGDVVEPNPNGPERDTANAPLSDKQRKIYRLLEGLNPALARMYFGALLVLADSTNPDRLALAAHGIREIMEKMPLHFEVPIGIQLHWSKIDSLVKAWEKENGNEKNENDESLSRKFMKDLRDFFDWVSINRPNRTGEAREFLERLVPIEGSIAPDVADSRLEEWSDSVKYFNLLSHHKLEPDQKEFEERESIFTDILIDFAQPPTFETADLLDRIIAEGEKNE